MPFSPHLLRVRLYRGHVTHAARELPVSGSQETACEHSVDVLAENQWLPGDSPVTCLGCQVLLRRAGR